MVSDLLVKRNSELLHDCLRHYKKFCDERLTNNILMLVHPFYYTFSPGFFKQTEINDYLDNLTIALRKTRSDDDWSRVYWDFPLSYDMNKDYVEAGWFNTVRLTVYRQGVPLDNDLSDFDGKNLVLAGIYGDLCVRSMMNSLLHWTDESIIYLLSEALIFSQQSPEGIHESNEALTKRMINDLSLGNGRLRLMTLDSLLVK